MAEIERKFLVEEMPRAESGQTEIEQGYLALDEHAEVRLRRQGGELLLTAKTGHGEVREEVEVPIEPRAFEALWPLTAGRRVRKVRHYVPLRRRAAGRGRRLRRRPRRACSPRRSSSTRSRRPSASGRRPGSAPS